MGIGAGRARGDGGDVGCRQTRRTDHHRFAAAQALQGADQGGEVAVAFLLGLFDRRQHAPHGIDHAEQGAGNLGVEAEMPVAQPAEEMLASVGDVLQPREAQEAGGALDGVQGAEDAGKRVALGRLLLQGHEVQVELGQVLMGFQQEFTKDLVHGVATRESARTGSW